MSQKQIFCVSSDLGEIFTVFPVLLNEYMSRVYVQIWKKQICLKGDFINTFLGTNFEIKICHPLKESDFMILVKYSNLSHSIAITRRTKS